MELIIKFNFYPVNENPEEPDIGVPIIGKNQDDCLRKAREYAKGCLLRWAGETVKVEEHNSDNYFYVPDPKEYL